MKQYQELLRKILDEGVEKSDRTGTGTKSLFGYQMRFDLSEGFPLLTTKKLHLKSIIYELLWFIKGDTNVHYLQEHGVRIWNEWADEAGDLGPIYGAQWRHWRDAKGQEHDQLAEAIETIKSHPDSRRIIVSAWNVGQLQEMHVFLGVPFNIASYALLLMMVAKVTGLKPGTFVHTLGDAHLYLNHLEQARIQLGREPRALPKMNIVREVTSIDDFRFEDFELVGYDPHPHIKAEVSV